MTPDPLLSMCIALGCSLACFLMACHLESKATPQRVWVMAFSSVGTINAVMFGVNAARILGGQ